MSELQGAVALAQLRKLPRMVESRQQRARELSALLGGIPGLALPAVRADAVHAYWRYAMRVDPAVHDGGAVQLGARLAERGISANARYIRKPAFECGLFREQKTFGQSRWPFTLARPEAIDHDPSNFPGAYAALADIVVLPWNERLSAGDVETLAQEIRECVQPPIAACA